jgi:site-specific DNA-methyltransferase (adenine-specific)
MGNKKTFIKRNVWRIGTNQEGYDHPAIFPEQLAYDHIISWSNKGDTVLDCFSGCKIGPQFQGYRTCTKVL